MTADADVLATGLRFPEGPVALDDGSVLVAEVAGGTLARVRPGGAVEVVAECGGGPNGVAIGPDGAAYVCNNGGQDFVDAGGSLRISLVTQATSYRGGCIQRVDLDTGRTTVLYESCDGHGLSAPNDLVFDPTGGFWFTDTGKARPRDRDWGGVYYAQPDGSSIRAAIFPLDTPNGIGLSPDGSRLYVSETTTGRVWWWEVRAPGVVHDDPHTGRGRHLLAGPGGATFLDSLAVEAGGNVCVATLFRGGITVIDPHGGVVEVVAFPDPLVTNLCFGGPDLATAYVTLSSTGRLARAAWARPGRPLAWGC